MLVSIFSPKGGSGTSTSACLLAKSFSTHMPTLPIMLIDAHNGDLESIVGIERESEYGFVQWTESANPNINNLEKISNNVNGNLAFVAQSTVKQDRFSTHSNVEADNVEKLEKITCALSDARSICIVDLGTRVDETASAIIGASDLVIMVMKACYIGLNRATLHPYCEYSDACIFIEEQGRSITSKQISEVLKINCIIEMDARRDFARAIDAGVLLFRTPKNMLGAIDAFIGDVCDHLEGAQNQMVQTSVHSTHSTKTANDKDFDRTQNLSRQSFDIFDDSTQQNKRDFWNEDAISRPEQHADFEEARNEISHRSRRSAIKNPIDVAYTSHLHSALAGMKKSNDSILARDRSGRS